MRSFQRLTLCHNLKASRSDLEYSGRPNIVGAQGSLYPGSTDPVESGVMKFWRNANWKLPALVSTNPGEPVGVTIDASRGSSLYQDNLTEVRVNGLFGMMLIRGF